MTGVEMIAAERERQMSAEGWTAEHDAEHHQGELACAAAAYVLATIDSGSEFTWEHCEDLWPFEPSSFKPGYRYTGPPVPLRDVHVRDLVRAGALIAAEIDRLAAPTEGESE